MWFYPIMFFLWDRRQGGPDEEEQSQWTRATDHCLGLLTWSWSWRLPGQGGAWEHLPPRKPLHLLLWHCSSLWVSQPAVSEEFLEANRIANAILTGAFITGWILSQFKKLATYYCDHFIEEHFDSENYGKSVSPEASKRSWMGVALIQKVTYQPGILNMLRQGCCHLKQALPMGQCSGPSTGPLSARKSPSSPAVAVKLRGHLSFRKGNTALVVDATH